VPGFTGAPTTYLDLAVSTSENTPYLALRDNTAGGLMSVFKYTGTTWEAVGSPFGSKVVWFTSIAFNGSGIPYVAFSESGGLEGTDEAKVFKFSGIDWEQVGSSIEGGGVLSLAISPADETPHIAYINTNNSIWKANVKKFSGSDWEQVGSADFSDGIAGQINLAISSGGTPYVIYSDDTYGNRACVKRYNGLDWENAGSPGFSSDMSFYNSIAISPSGEVYVTYTDSAMRVKTLVADNWVDVGSVPYGVASTKIKIASDGTPYVGFTNAVEGLYRENVIKYTGSWVQVGQANLSAGNAFGSAIAIGTDNLPVVAYMDDPYENKVSVQKLTVH
jgi:hypothetical protein